MMKRFRPVLLLAGARCRAALLGVVAPIVLAAAVQAPSLAAATPQVVQGGDGARARELFKKARDEYRDGHLPQAYALFLEAWAIQKSFDIAGNLATVEKQLTRYREAAEHATYALANFPAGGTDTQRKALQDVLADARTYVGTITVRVSVDHAAVALDGRPLGDSPLAADVFVEPGTHTLTASAPGCDPASDTVRTDKGTSHLMTLTPARCGGRVVTGPPQPGTPQTGPNPITVAGFVTAGVGLGLGTAFAILAKVKGTDADAKFTSLGMSPTACAGPSPSADCTALHDLRVSHDTFANAAVWTFVAAGAVGAGTLIYTFAVPHAPAAPPAVKAVRAQVIPVAGPGAGGLLVKGAF